MDDFSLGHGVKLPCRMYRVMVLYDEVPDADSYAEHVEVCKQVPGGVFRYGPVTGSPMGETKHAYYAEWEFPDKAAFEAARAERRVRGDR